MAVRRWRNRLLRWVRRDTPVWYAAAYRLPLASIEATGIDARRTDLALAFLADLGVVGPRNVRTPPRIEYSELLLVHSAELLERLQRPEHLAPIFSVDASEIVVDEVWQTIRLACGGTLEAARAAIERCGPAVNLLGGFHHAGPERGAGFCPVNDIAVAVAVLRQSGFGGLIAVLDLDAHPPDGIAECLGAEPDVWIGSLSGVDWGALPTVDETVLPPGCDDEHYLGALFALLRRMPEADLTFVIAGGDVLAGDRCGGLGLSLDGLRRRDLGVAAALRTRASVWLPGGGYSPRAWRALAGTVLAVVLGSSERVPAAYDSLRRRFGSIARELDPQKLEGAWLTERDLLADLGGAAIPAERFLGFYTREGVEYALARYGILPHVKRLGYDRFRLTIGHESNGDRLQVFGHGGGHEHLLVECVLERQRHEGHELLYIHWLTLRHPRVRFSPQRPPLPGQEVPGLGLAREAGELLGQAAARLGLAGIAFRPAWYHMAYQARIMGMDFADPRAAGRFEALRRDLGDRPLRDVTLAIAERRVTLNGEPYGWEAELMVHHLAGSPLDRAKVAVERERAHFTLLEGSA